MNQHIKVWDDQIHDQLFIEFLGELMEACNIVSVIPQNYSPKSNKMSKAIIIYTLK